MNTFNQSFMVKNEEELVKIYEAEARILRENNFKLLLLKRLKIEDFSSDLPEPSKRNIKKALTAVKIKNHINLANGQKLLGLEEYDISKVNLNYNEKKLIREHIEHLISLEKMKRGQAEPDPKDELRKVEAKLVEIQKENIKLTQQLEELKHEEFELLKEVIDVLVSPTQQILVQKILNDAKIVNLKAHGLNQVITDSEMSRTQHCKKAIAEISAQLDQLLHEKQTKSNKSTKMS